MKPCLIERASGLNISLKQIVIMVVTFVLLTGFWYLVQKTPLGRAQRACEQDSKMAALLGINVDRTISITFIMGAALAAVAGVMYMIQYGVVNFADGFVPGVKAFTAAVLGGIGSLPGAVLGGLIIGLIEALEMSGEAELAAEVVTAAGEAEPSFSLSLTANLRLTYWLQAPGVAPKSTTN